jgi:hypothetical protein
LPSFSIRTEGTGATVSRVTPARISAAVLAQETSGNVPRQ